MVDYLASLLFLVTVFVAFGLVHRNKRCGSCHGACDESACDKNKRS